MTTKKADYVEIDYVAKIADSGKIYDVTDEKSAKFHNIYNPNLPYTPSIVCIGQKDVIPGLDKFLEGKELNKDDETEISAEEAYGKKDAKLIKLIPTSALTKQNIQPVPGVQVNMDGNVGTIKTVTGGRTLIDFNHPLSSHNVIYKIKINKIVTDPKEKIQGFLKNTLSIPNVDVDVKDNIANIKVNIPESLQKPVIDEIKKRVPELKDIKITVKS